MWRRSLPWKKQPSISPREIVHIHTYVCMYIHPCCPIRRHSVQYFSPSPSICIDRRSSATFFLGLYVCLLSYLLSAYILLLPSSHSSTITSMIRVIYTRYHRFFIILLCLLLQLCPVLAASFALCSDYYYDTISALLLLLKSYLCVGSALLGLFRVRYVDSGLSATSP